MPEATVRTAQTSLTTVLTLINDVGHAEPYERWPRPWDPTSVQYVHHLIRPRRSGDLRLHGSSKSSNSLEFQPVYRSEAPEGLDTEVPRPGPYAHEPHSGDNEDPFVAFVDPPEANDDDDGH